MFDLEALKRLIEVNVEALHEREIRGFFVGYNPELHEITIGIVCHCGRTFSASSTDEIKVFEVVAELFNQHMEIRPKDESLN